MNDPCGVVRHRAHANHCGAHLTVPSSTFSSRVAMTRVASHLCTNIQRQKRSALESTTSLYISLFSTPNCFVREMWITTRETFRVSRTIHVHKVSPPRRESKSRESRHDTRECQTGQPTKPCICAVVGYARSAHNTYKRQKDILR